MTEHAEHTPTPWHIADGGQFDIGTIRRASPDDPVCELGGFYDPNSKANAAFIVRAVNSHAAMVEALKEARRTINFLHELDSEETITGLVTIKEIDAALELAEGHR